MQNKFYACFSKINIFLQNSTNESRKNPRGEPLFGTSPAGARNVPPEFLNSGGIQNIRILRQSILNRLPFSISRRKGSETMAKLDELKQKLTAKQIQAAYLLVENELMESNNEEKRTQDEMANELGINRTTLWEWRTKNQDFIAFKSEVADSFLAEKREQVYSKLMQLILGPQPSVKAMQLYMQRFGLLTDKKVIEGDLGNATRTNAEIEEQLEKLKKLTGE